MSTMLRLGVRRFTTSAIRAAETASQIESANLYGIGVSKAQGIVKGLTGGKTPLHFDVRNTKHDKQLATPH
jgi:cysteine synthase A